MLKSNYTSLRRLGIYNFICLALALFAIAATAPVKAQTTYKCGSSYSQSPCEGGLAVTTDDKRTPDQKAQAQNTAEREKQAANNLEQSRLTQEKRAAADLKKANAVKNKAAKKAEKTTLRPIKNKNVQADPGMPPTKAAKKSSPKKAKPEVGGK